jgi:hypothetical protein
VRVLLKVPLPALAVPRVLGIDDFALRRSSACATVLIGAQTGRRAGVVPGRTADVAEKWLRATRELRLCAVTGRVPMARRSAGYCPARSRSATAGTCGTASVRPCGTEAAAHSACWAKAGPLQSGKRAETTLERWQQVHELRARNVGLLECARRLSLSLNTVKRYDRASEPERLQPSIRCSTITTATIIGGTDRRPTSSNRPANISSGNKVKHSGCKIP